MGWLNKLGFGGKKKGGPDNRSPVNFLPEVPEGEELPDLDQNLVLEAREMLAEAVQWKAESMTLTWTGEAPALHLKVDGIPHPRPEVDPQTFPGAMEVIEYLVGINPEQRRATEQREFKFQYEFDKKKAKITSQKNNAGAHKMLIEFDGVNPTIKNLEQAGMPEDLLKRLKPIVNEFGVVLVSSTKGGGFTTVYNAVYGTVDRYMRNAASVEPADTNEPIVENVTVKTFDEGLKQFPHTILPGLLRTYPDVVGLRELKDAETGEMLSEQPENERTIIVGVRAADCTEAVLRSLMIKMPRDKWVKSLTAVVHQRVMRKLCENCKNPYKPTPQMLKQLGPTAAKVQAFYRPGTPKPLNYDPRRDEILRMPPEVREKLPPKMQRLADDLEVPEVCPVCHGIGYVGRTGLWEVMEMTDEMRGLFLKSNNPDEIRKAARRLKHRLPLDEGILIAARGVTSIQEVMRVLKG